MACISPSLTGSTGGFCRSSSSENLIHPIRRSYSDNHLSLNTVRASATHSKIKNSRSFPILSNLLKPSPNNNENAILVDQETVIEEKKVNWMERLMEIRSRWREKQQTDSIEDVHDRDECDENCEVDYDDTESDVKFNDESFSQFLRSVSWSDIKLFSQLAFLCNMAYTIPKIKVKDLKRFYGLDFVTSSLEKKANAGANLEKTGNNEKKQLPQPFVAYEIAASAANYVHSRAKDILALCSESEMAAQVAASTMTAVIAAGEKEKQETAMDLQSLHSSPCEWFVCDDSSIYTRCFVIQGSESLASWQANLFFEPTKFEGTEVLVHRGIYEAAKGVYEQFMPEIMHHLNRFGDRAKFQFTGHSLGGSLALLVNLMLVTRKIVEPSALLPVVTFGSPFIFCGGHKLLAELGLDENHVHSVMMHRDIVPRAFSCNYPDQAVKLLKRLNSTFRSHPCLNKNKLLYSPMGKIFILQPEEKWSPPLPLLPPGSAIYKLENTSHGTTKSALKAFLNSPHPLETLSDPGAYGSDGTIIRDHDSNNYMKALNDVIRQKQKKQVVRKSRKERHLLWTLLTTQSPHAWKYEGNWEVSRSINHKIMTGV